MTDTAPHGPAEDLGCILVVEPDAGIRQRVRALLAAEGYRILEAEDAAVGASLLRQPQHRGTRLILLAVDREAARAARSIVTLSVEPDHRTILIMAHEPLRRPRARALEMSEDAVLSRPPQRADLLAAVRRAQAGRLARGFPFPADDRAQHQGNEQPKEDR
jgi:DNA-binding response OmpR family regulator